MTKEQLTAKRLAAQNAHFQEFERCPSCFVRQTQGAARTFLFDAVVDCSTTLRVGTWGDGGKWLCEPDRLARSAVVYSFGVGNEISFDREMAAVFGAEVYLFDPTPSLSHTYELLKSGKAEGYGMLYFHALGLGPISKEPKKAWTLTLEGQPCPVMSFADIAKAIGNDHVDILKIDVEGSELAALRQILTEGSLLRLRVQQLLVEFHLWTDEALEDFVRIVRGLSDQGYRIFRKELNPADAAHCAEFSFVRVSPPRHRSTIE